MLARVRVNPLTSMRSNPRFINGVPRIEGPASIAGQEATDREHAPAVGIVLVEGHGLLGKAAGVQPARLAQTQTGKLADRYSRVRARHDGSVEELLGGVTVTSASGSDRLHHQVVAARGGLDRSGRCAVAGDGGWQQEQGQVTADAPDALESLRVDDLVRAARRVVHHHATVVPRHDHDVVQSPRTVLDQHDQGAVMSQMLRDECGILPGRPRRTTRGARRHE